MSSFSTFSPSFEQTYCCFRRAPSFLCSQLNEIAADDSPAENILIGTETSPKEIVAEPIECAGIGPAGDRVSVRPTASGYYHWREGGSILRPPAAPIATRCAFGLQWTTPVTPTRPTPPTHPPPPPPPPHPPPRRQTPGRARRGPPHRVRRLRGDHPRRELRRGRGDRMGPRRVGATRRSGGGARQGEAALRAARLQAARRLDAREDQEVGEGLAPDQGAGRLYLEERGHVSPRIRAVGADGRGAARRQQESGEARGRVEEAQGARARRPCRGCRSHARGNAGGAVLPRWVGVRGEARRLSHASGEARRNGPPDHTQRQRLLRGLPGADPPDRRTAVLQPHYGWGAGDPGRAGAAELSTSPEPGAHRTRPGDPPCVRRNARHALSLRPDGGRRIRPAVPAAREAQGTPEESGAGGGTPAVLGAFREGRRGAVRPGGGNGPRGNRR